MVGEDFRTLQKWLFTVFIVALLIPFESQLSLAEALSKDQNATMVRIPEGVSLMGSPQSEGGTNEHPQHEVYLDSFLID
jgi:formylglycine-generating enzyme required for sulfatase activity